MEPFMRCAVPKKLCGINSIKHVLVSGFRTVDTDEFQLEQSPADWEVLTVE
jgi:hypothetical protein